jgi:hypothetical protein
MGRPLAHRPSQPRLPRPHPARPGIHAPLRVGHPTSAGRKSVG